MDLEKDDFRTVLDDVRARHAAVVALLYFTDTQALALFRLYATLAIAAGSGAAAVFASSTAPRALGWGLAAAMMMLVAGMWFCIEALRSRPISLPGRGPDFWLWAARPDITRDAAFKAYLETLASKTLENVETNRINGIAYQRAKLCSLAVPPMALVGCGVALWLGL
ncbi:MAG: hypothetical protein K2Z80_04645 [Xanthobacteraceae bacterium]|nr:hypothetical protein [Xanthobacteraceae bacterium]